VGRKKSFWLGFFFGFSLGLRLPQIIKLFPKEKSSSRECYLCGVSLLGSGKLVPHSFIREAIAGGLSPFRVPDCGPFLLRMFEIRRKKFPAYEYPDFREDFESFWKAIYCKFFEITGRCAKEEGNDRRF